MDKEQMYKENEAMIYHMANKFSNYDGDFDEKVCEANLIFAECVNRFEGRSKFSSYLYQSLKRGLQEKRRDVEFVAVDESILPGEYREPMFLSDLDLSGEAWAVVSEILKAPIELIASPKNKITKQSLMKHLRKNKGWKHSDVRKVYQEISSQLQEAIG